MKLIIAPGDATTKSSFSETAAANSPSAPVVSRALFTQELEELPAVLVPATTLTQAFQKSSVAISCSSASVVRRIT